MGFKDYSDIVNKTTKNSTNSRKNAWKKSREEEKSSSSSSGIQDFSYVVDRQILTKTINMDTFQSDIESSINAINNIYGGWQTKETMINTRASIESLYDRLVKYQDYQNKYGGTDLSGLRDSYKQILDGWDNIASDYGKFKSADAYTTEKNTLNKLYSMSSKDIAPFLNQKSSKSSATSKTELSLMVPDMIKPFTYNPETAKNYPLELPKWDSTKNSSVAYTTSDGYNITWKSLYDDAILREKNEEIMSKPDFATKSAYKKKDVTYEKTFNGYSVISDEAAHKYNYINGDKQASDHEMLTNVNMSGTSDSPKGAYYTDEEKRIFNYLWETEGPEKAEEYDKLISSELRKRRVEHDRQLAAQNAKESPIASSVASVIANVGNNMLAPALMAIDAFDGDGIDENSSLYQGRRAVETTRGTVEGMIDNGVGKFFYRHGLNTADNVLAMAAGGFGKYGIISKAITTGSMSAGALVDTTLDAKSRGLSDAQALTLGAIAGGAEYFFESRAFEALFDSKTLTQSAWKYFVNNIKTEVIGELGTELTNDVADALIAQDLGSLKTEYRGYVSSGMSKKEALASVALNVAKRYGDVALGTIFSSGAISGPSAVAGTTRQNSSFAQSGGNIRTNERISDVFDIASLSPEVSSAYEAYTQYAKKGINAENVSDKQLGRLFSLEMMEAQEILDSKTATAEEKQAAMERINELTAYAQGKPTDRVDAKVIKNDSKTAEEDSENPITMLIESGLESNADTSSYKLAKEYDEKIKSGKTLSQKEISKLMEANAEAVNAENRTAVTERLTELGESEENISEVAELIARKLGGEILTKGEQQTIENSKYGSQVLREQDSINVGTNENIEARTETMSEEDAELFKRLYDGKTDIDAYANDFNLISTYAEKGFSEKYIDSQKTSLTPRQVSEIYKAKTIEVAHKKQAEIKAKNEATANKMTYKGFIDDSIIEYDDMPSDVASMSFKFGGQAQPKIQKQNTTAKNAEAKSGETKAKVSWSELNPRQRQGITFVKGLAQATGMNLMIVADAKFNGAYHIKDNTIYLDVYAGLENLGQLVDTIIPTMSHEVTHWMKDKAPELWRQLNEIVFSTLVDHYNLNTQESIKDKIALLNKLERGVEHTEEDARARTITEKDIIDAEYSRLYLRNLTDGRTLDKEALLEEARDEIIARACEDMLSMSEQGKKYFNSLQQTEKKTLIDKIKDLIKTLKDWVADLLSSYTSTSKEATILRQYEDKLNEMSKIWDKMLAESVEANQGLEKSGTYKHDITSIGSRNLTEVADALTTDGNAMFQYKAMVEDEQTYREMLLKHQKTIGITNKQINDLFMIIDNAIDVISENLEALDYAWDENINDRAFHPIKQNSDKLYKVSLDFSTLCRKRLLQQTIQQTLQNALNTQLSKEEAIAIRDELIKVQEEGRKIEVACALCYVESARMKSPKQITKFLNNKESVIREFFANRSGGSIKEKIQKAETKARETLKKKYPDGMSGKNGITLNPLDAKLNQMLKDDAEYIRDAKRKAKQSYELTETEQKELDAALNMSVTDFTSAKGLENLAKKHPDIFDAYTSYIRNATHSKGIESDVWWRAGDSDSIGDTLIKQMNEENGLRSQSWSDFQVIHLLDYIAATIELSTKGAKRQSYTKVPDYVKLLGNTGDMINMSVIPERAFSGKLGYDDVEGMPYKEARELRERYHNTAGIICIGMDDAQIRLLLEDNTIDMVIPYHSSSMSKDTRKLMHIPSWKDYQAYQNESSKLTEAEAIARAKEYGVKLKKDDNYQKAPKFSEWFDIDEARQIAKMENDNPSDEKAHKKLGVMYGAYKAMQNAANNYLKLCAERGLAPKFSHKNADYTKEANYWKLLIDRKMVDNVTGEIIEQQAIKPIFNEKDVLGILNDELARYPQVKADQEYATRKVTEKFLSGDMKMDDSTREAIKKPIDNITNVNILESAEGLRLSDKDAEYLELAKNPEKNEEKLREMVEEAAKQAGYDIKAYHGTPNNDFTVFDKNRVGKGIDQYGAGFYFASNKDAASAYGERVIDSVLALNKPFKIDGSSEVGSNLITAGDDYLLTEEQAFEIIKRLPNIYDSEESPLGDYYDSYWESGAEDWMIKDLASNEFNRNIGYLDSDLFRYYPNELHEALRDVVGYDGVEVNFANGDKFYVAWFNEQMKSSDLVTYDDNGNIIPLSKRFNTENEDIRYSEKDYSYEAIVSKHDMELMVLDENVPNNRADIIHEAKKKAAKIGVVNAEDESVSVFVDDIKRGVKLNRDGLQHSLNRGKGLQTKPIGIVTLNAGEILKNAIRINELTPSKKSASGSYVLIGAAKDTNNNLYIVRFVVNQYDDNLESLDVLYAINTKKESAVLNAPRYTNDSLSVTDSTISIAKLLDYVNKYFPDVLPESILKYFGYDERPTGQFSKDLLFSEKQESLYGLMGEQERIKKENEALREDVARLNERLKLERQITGGNEFNMNQIVAVAGHLRNLAKSNMDKVELMKELKGVYTYIATSENVAWDELMSKCLDVSKKLVAEAKPITITDDFAKQLLKEIRHTRISLSESQKKEASYIFDKYWNRNFMGKVIIADDGTPIEVKWQEWNSLYPDVFRDDLSDGDKIRELYDIINSLKATSEMVDEYSMSEQTRWLAEEIYNGYWNISPIRTTADKYNNKLNLLKSKHKQMMNEVRADYNTRIEGQKLADDIYYGRKLGEQQSKYNNKLKAKNEQIEKQKELYRKLRDRKDNEIALAKERGKEKLDIYKDKALKKTYIQRITANALTLNKWLTKNSKDYHIHEAMKGPVIKLLNAIDFSSKTKLESGEMTQKDISFAEAFSEVKAMLQDADNMVEGLEALYGHDLSEKIELISKVSFRLVGDNNYVINAMSNSELESLDYIVTEIKRVVTDINKFHTVQHSKGAVNLANEFMEYGEKIGNIKKQHGTMAKFFEFRNRTPYYFFKGLGDVGVKLFNAFQDGWDKLAFNAKQIIDYSEETYTTKEVQEWSKETKKFNLLQKNGETRTFEMSIAQIMALHCVAKQKDAKTHLLSGGMTLKRFDSKGHVITDYENITLTVSDIQTILESLSDRQREVADKLQKFMNTVCSEWGNEISMERFGIKMFGIPDYFPIKVSEATVPTDNTKDIDNASLFRLLNMSFTKSRNKNAKQSIEIGDIFDIFAQHSSDMAKYNALALPVLDFNKFYSIHGTDFDGKEYGVVKTLKSVFGDEANGYIRRFVRDLNSSQNVSRDVIGNTFFKNAKVASVAANMRVVLLQPTAFYKAGAVMDNKYLLKASAYIKLDPVSMVNKLKEAISKAEKYCGIIQWKALGYYDTDISKGLTEKIKHAYSVKDKIVEKSLKGAEIADKVTFGTLWVATEFEIRDKHKELKVGSKEYYEAVSKRLREIIYATQVVDSTMTRSDMMRSSDGRDKILTAFASEPTIAYNMLLDLAITYNTDEKLYGAESAIKLNSKKFRKVVTAYVITNAVAALVESAFDVFRDDEEEMDEIQFLKLYFKNFLLDMSIGNKLPYIKEAYSFLQGYSSSRMDTQWMQSALYVFKDIKKMAEGEGETVKLIKDTLKAMSYISGLPAYNVFRDSMAMLDKIGIIDD